jgi:hypothetical protein
MALKKQTREITAAAVQDKYKFEYRQHQQLASADYTYSILLQQVCAGYVMLH